MGFLLDGPPPPPLAAVSLCLPFAGAAAEWILVSFSDVARGICGSLEGCARVFCELDGWMMQLLCCRVGCGQDEREGARAPCLEAAEALSRRLLYRRHGQADTTNSFPIGSDGHSKQESVHVWNGAVAGIHISLHPRPWPGQTGGRARLHRAEGAQAATTSRRRSRGR